MKGNTSVSLGAHFEGFIDSQIADGRYKNASEVIRSALRLLEEEEQLKIQRARAIVEALEKGEASGIAEDFDPEGFLAQIHAHRVLKTGFNNKYYF